MKKIMWFLAPLAVMAGACTNDDFEGLSTDGTVTYTVGIADDAAGSRAFGDGLSAKTLQYAVYDADNGDEFVSNGTASFAANSLTTTVNLQLVNGRKYKVAFFAYYNSNGVYKFDAPNAKVKVNYSGMASVASQRNDYDAFYKMDEFTVGSAVNRSVVLKRPVAQINWGTDDYDYQNNGAVNSAYGSSLRTKLELTACDELNLLTGEAAGAVNIADGSARPQSLIAETYGSFPVNGYQWLNSKYVLVPENAPVMDMKLHLYRGSTPVSTVEVSNVPVGRNYRTNIYGSLLTSPYDVKVVKEVIFTEPDYNKEVWKGNATDPEVNVEGQYVIKMASDLAGLARMVNGGSDLSGKTVLLDADLDLGNLAWTPIGTKTAPFRGTFDGQNHVIRNLNVSLSGKPSAPAGLFGSAWSAGEIKNITIDGVTIDATGMTTPAENGTGALIGTYVGTGISNVTVRNADLKAYRWTGGIAGYTYTSIRHCRVEGLSLALEFEQLADGSWDNGDKGGGIVGIANESSSNVYEDNVVGNFVISGYRHVGGIIGFINSGSVARNNSAENGTVTQMFNHNYKNIQPGALVSETIGEYVAGTDAATNTATNVTLYKASEVAEAGAIAEALAQGGYVGIGADLDLTSLSGQVTISKPTVIDLRNHSVKVNGGQLVNSSELTIESDGGRIDGERNLIVNTPEGKLTVNGGEFSVTATNLNAAAIYTEGETVINGGRFNGGCFAVNVNLSGWKNHNKTIVINGGTFIVSAETNYALNLYGNGDADHGNKAVIEGGTFIGRFGAARADNGIDVTVNGGVYICTGPYHGFVSGAENYGSENTTVTVNGGMFYAANGNSLCRAGQSKMVVKNAVINKTTGNFTVAEGSAVVDADENITVEGSTYTFTHKVAVK